MTAKLAEIVVLDDIEHVRLSNGNTLEGDERIGMCYDAINLAVTEHCRPLVEAAKAYRDLNSCYRLGKRPSNELFVRLEEADKALEAHRNE